MPDRIHVSIISVTGRKCVQIQIHIRPSHHFGVVLICARSVTAPVRVVFATVVEPGQIQICVTKPWNFNVEF